MKKMLCLFAFFLSTTSFTHPHILNCDDQRGEGLPKWIILINEAGTTGRIWREKSDLDFEKIGGEFSITLLGDGLTQTIEMEYKENTVVNWAAPELAEMCFVRLKAYAVSVKANAGVFDGQFIEYPHIENNPNLPKCNPPTLQLRPFSLVCRPY